MPRGFTWQTYTADNGITFQTLVDADEALDVTRGWGAAVVLADMLPRGFRERRVYGVSASSGRRGSTRVGSLTASLWTGGSSTFFVEANNGTTDTMTVTSRVGERRRTAH